MGVGVPEEYPVLLEALGVGENEVAERDEVEGGTDCNFPDSKLSCFSEGIGAGEGIDVRAVGAEGLFVAIIPFILDNIVG